MSFESNKEYSVNWKNHIDHVRKALDDLFSNNELVDVTMCCEGKKIGAHKLLLSACSGYFREIFKDVPCPHPIIFLKGVEYEVLVDILHFIYNGEVSVDTANLDSFIKTAQLLQISGLTENTDNSKLTTKSEQRHSSNNENNNEIQREENQSVASPSVAVSKVQSSNNAQTSNRANKRVSETRDNASEFSREKISKNVQENLYFTDVKTEPNELITLEEENVVDPLQSDLSVNDAKDFYGYPNLQNVPEEEFKRDFYHELKIVNISSKIEKKNIRKKAFKRGSHFCHNNYKYQADKKDNSARRIYWRCSRHRHERCTGRLITDLDYNVIRVSVPHLPHSFDLN